MLRGTRLIGEDDGHRCGGQLLEDLRIRTRSLGVGGDDQPAGIGDVLTQLHQAGVRGGQHRGDPVTLGVQCRAPGLGGLLRVEGLTQPCRVFLAGAVAPACLTGVGEEDHGPDHTVGKRLGIAVGVVRPGDHVPVLVLRVTDKRDGGIIGSEGRTGQRETVLGIAVGLTDALTPALGVTTVVDLVEDHQ